MPFFVFRSHKIVHTDHRVLAPGRRHWSVPGRGRTAHWGSSCCNFGSRRGESSSALVLGEETHLHIYLLKAGPSHAMWLIPLRPPKEKYGQLVNTPPIQKLVQHMTIDKIRKCITCFYVHAPRSPDIMELLCLMLYIEIVILNVPLPLLLLAKSYIIFHVL